MFRFNMSSEDIFYSRKNTLTLKVVSSGNLKNILAPFKLFVEF